jgi:hypothetical protein
MTFQLVLKVASEITDKTDSRCHRPRLLLTLLLRASLLQPNPSSAL